MRGDTPEDILFAHVYLHRLKQPQVFGTQFTNNEVSRQEGWTMEPYNRQLLAPSLLEANCVPDREHQAEMLNAIRRGEEPPAPKQKPCAKLPGN